MTKEEQLGVPPIQVMRQLLDENRALVRLLSAHTINHHVKGTQAERCSEPDSSNALSSAYREVLELLEILSITSVAGNSEVISGR